VRGSRCGGEEEEEDSGTIWEVERERCLEGRGFKEGGS